MAKFHPNTLFVVVFFLVLLALIVTPFNQTVQTILVLSVPAFPFLDLCRQCRKLAIFPLSCPTACRRTSSSMPKHSLLHRWAPGRVSRSARQTPSQ